MDLSLFCTMHSSLLKETWYPLSHNWLITSRLCFNLSTNKTVLIGWDGGIPILPTLVISSFLFPPKVMVPLGIESGIGTYTFLLSCAMSNHYLGTMIGVSFLLSRTSATWIIFSLGTQIFCDPFLLVLNALDDHF